MKHLCPFLRWITALLLCLLAPLAVADEATIAVAANFAPAMKELQKRFEQSTTHTLLISYGSSGSLYTQIKNGAPFQVFLSADAERPAKLESDGFIVPGSRMTYAVGCLALWSSRPAFVDPRGAILKQKNFRKLAIADPGTAPYGVAARETLIHLKLWEVLQPKLVRGMDIGQACQFVATGNADLGFVAYSQILAQGMPKGSWWLVPKEYYQPIRQQAVLLAGGENHPAARAFLQFLGSRQSRDLIKPCGYDME